MFGPIRFRLLCLCCLLTLPLMGWGQELHGKYGGSHALGIEGETITFLPGNRFTLSGSHCTGYWEGVGTYELLGKQLTLRFEQHPEEIVRRAAPPTAVSIRETTVDPDSILEFRVCFIDNATGRPVADVLAIPPDSIGWATFQRSSKHPGTIAVAQFLSLPFGYAIPTVIVPPHDAEIIIRAGYDSRSYWFVPPRQIRQYVLRKDRKKKGQICLIELSSRPRAVYRYEEDERK